jgi:hypothetical protein
MPEYFVFLHPFMQEDVVHPLLTMGDERTEVPFRQFKNTKVCGTQSLQVV